MALPGLYDIFNEKWCKQTVWLYSDPHFGDEELRKIIPNRPSDEELVQMINSKVGRKDTIIFLGDIGNPEYIKKIKGYKILICGNHDAGISNYKRKIVRTGFNRNGYTRKEAMQKMAEIHPNCKYKVYEKLSFPSFYWVVEADNCLFDEVYSGPLMVGEKLLLSHEPVNIPWVFNLHGHIHNIYHKNDKYHFNVCSDAIGYIPINFNQWLKKGYLSQIESIHRATINEATKRKEKRNGKKIKSK